MRRSFKSTQTIITGSILAAGLTLTLSASAAPDNDRFPISLAEIEARSTEHFAKIDTDRSGDIDITEFEAAEMPRSGHPMRMRGNHHQGGKETARGPRNGHPRGLPDSEARQLMRATIEAELFAIMDSDSDGVISKAEFTDGNKHEARRTARKRAMFKVLDTNQDQRLSADEMPNPAKRLQDADSDADGSISRKEMHAHHRSIQQKKHQDQEAG